MGERSDAPTKGVNTARAAVNLVPAAKAIVAEKTIPAKKETSTLLDVIGKNKGLLIGPVTKKVEDQLTKPNGLSKSIGLFKKPNALALAGPLTFSSAPIMKNWYEETEAEEKEPARKAIGSSSAPSGPDRFVATRKGADMEPLAIEEIISPLKDLIDIPITVEDTTSSEKKKKGFTATLHARKKIVNTLARNGKMIKTSRLTMNDFASVAKPRPSKAGPDKGNFSKTSKALVLGGPPVKG
ncbi:unnamed protein product [Cochlearia groenlandica]